MSNGIKASTRTWVALGVAVVTIVAGALAFTSQGQSRGRLLAALEQPAVNAVPTPMPGGHAMTARVSDYRVQLRVGPNRAAVRNALSVRVTEHGRPLDGARVSVAFSMPSMNMWHVFTSRPAAAGNGTYETNVPVLGMSGNWQLRVRVDRATARPASINFNDRMGR